MMLMFHRNMILLCQMMMMMMIRLYMLLVATRAFYKPYWNTVCVYANPKPQRMTPSEARSFSVRFGYLKEQRNRVNFRNGTLLRIVRVLVIYFVTEYAKKKKKSSFKPLQLQAIWYCDNVGFKEIRISVSVFLASALKRALQHLGYLLPQEPATLFNKRPMFLLV